MFRIAICDDEHVICSQIEHILLNYSKRINLEIDIKVFYSGKELYKYMESDYIFDLIYLDIEMESMDGLELGKKIRNTMQNYKTDIIYISAKDCYDRQLFDVQPLHFIPKPIEANIVIKNLKLAMLRADKLGGIFRYNKANESYKRAINDIIYFENLGRKIKIVTVNDEDVFYGTIEEVIMSNGTNIAISQLRRKEVREIQLSILQEE